MATKQEVGYIKKHLRDVLNCNPIRDLKVYHNVKTNVMRVEYQLCDIVVINCDEMNETDLELKLITIIETTSRFDKLIKEKRLK